MYIVGLKCEKYNFSFLNVEFHTVFATLLLYCINNDDDDDDDDDDNDNNNNNNNNNNNWSYRAPLVTKYTALETKRRVAVGTAHIVTVLLCLLCSLMYV
jgi:hypothetical protein